MTPLANWTTNEVPTDSNMNDMIDDSPESILYVATPIDVAFKGKSGVTWQKAATLILSPVNGDYLCFRLQARAPSGTGQFKFVLNYPVNGSVADDLYTVTTVSGSGWVDYDATALLTGLTNTGDVTGYEASVTLYLNQYCEMRCVHIYSGQSATVSDYGGA